MKKILFQGDSITDAGRGDYSSPLNGGHGYANLLKADIMYSEPDTIVYNCGISGNRVVDLFARWKKDCLNLEPDILSIMIGVNDVWHEIDFKNGVDAEKYETVYRMILEETLKKLPGIKIIIMGSYLMHGSATDAAEGGFESFYNEVKIRREIAKKLASEYGLEYIDLQEKFDDAIKNIAPASHWSADGVHPTMAGHELIKRAWLEAYKKVM